MINQEKIEKGARFSLDRTHRYVLWRIWNNKLPKVVFIGLNPSTADENEDDATIRRLVGFAELNGYGGFYIVNLFSFRLTKSALLARVPVPSTKQNDNAIKEFINKSNAIVCMWGGRGVLHNRSAEVARWIKEMQRSVLCFGLTLKHNPKHPLYLPYKTELTPFTHRRAGH